MSKYCNVVIRYFPRILVYGNHSGVQLLYLTSVVLISTSSEVIRHMTRCAGLTALSPSEGGLIVLGDFEAF